LKVLIIGFGSIGKRHYDVLSQLSEVKKDEAKYKKLKLKSSLVMI
jgi:glyceraldehyde-3-phosphate dehydrogenase/erythrose-4-phosphate dehydrogenase